jgi:hypothetical protein
VRSACVRERLCLSTVVRRPADLLKRLPLGHLRKPEV